MTKLKNRGITLVALVITIVILLILAGITIWQLTGNGLFGKAQLAKEKQEDEQALLHPPLQPAVQLYVQVPLHLFWQPDPHPLVHESPHVALQLAAQFPIHPALEHFPEHPFLQVLLLQSFWQVKLQVL